MVQLQWKISDIVVNVLQANSFATGFIHYSLSNGRQRLVHKALSQLQYWSKILVTVQQLF